MKNYYVKIMSVFLGLFILMYGYPVRADLPLQGKVIVVDSGHGGLDPGALYNLSLIHISEPTRRRGNS